jgi:hypothetical protein
MSVSNAYNMDCMEALKEFPDGYFGLCIADPPYGINVTGRHKAKDGNTPLIGGGGRAFGGNRRLRDGPPRPFRNRGGAETAALKGESKSSKSSLRFILCSMIAPHRTQIHSGS